jgi:hypothetical protein
MLLLAWTRVRKSVTISAASVGGNAAMLPIARHKIVA